MLYCSFLHTVQINDDDDEDDVHGRASVTKDEERVLRGG